MPNTWVPCVPCLTLTLTGRSCWHGKEICRHLGTGRLHAPHLVPCADKRQTCPASSPCLAATCGPRQRGTATCWSRLCGTTLKSECNCCKHVVALECMVALLRPRVRMPALACLCSSRGRTPQPWGHVLFTKPLDAIFACMTGACMAALACTGVWSRPSRASSSPWAACPMSRRKC